MAKLYEVIEVGVRLRRRPGDLRSRRDDRCQIVLRLDGEPEEIDGTAATRPGSCRVARRDLERFEARIDSRGPRRGRAWSVSVEVGGGRRQRVRCDGRPRASLGTAS